MFAEPTGFSAQIEQETLNLSDGTTLEVTRTLGVDDRSWEETKRWLRMDSFSKDAKALRDWRQISALEPTSLDAAFAPHRQTTYAPRVGAVAAAAPPSVPMPAPMDPYRHMTRPPQYAGGTDARSSLSETCFSSEPPRRNNGAGSFPSANFFNSEPPRVAVAPPSVPMCKPMDPNRHVPLPPQSDPNRYVPLPPQPRYASGNDAGSFLSATCFNSEPPKCSARAGSFLSPTFFNSEPPRAKQKLLDDLGSCSGTGKVTPNDAIALGKKARSMLAEFDTTPLADTPHMTSCGAAVHPSKKHDRQATADGTKAWPEYQHAASVHPLILSKLRLIATLANDDSYFCYSPQPRCMA